MTDNKTTSSTPPVASSTTPRYEQKALGDEAKNFDFVSIRPPVRTTNILESIAHLIKSCLGGGIVAIHESYKECGLMTATCLNVILGIFVAYCMHMIVRSAQRLYGRMKVGQMSYPDLAEAAMTISPFPKMRKYSRCLRYLVDLTIGIDLFGSCCVYQVMIAKTIRQLVENVQDDSMAKGNIRLYVLCLLLPCILICMITSLKYLAPFSIVANVFILAVVVATVFYGSKAATKSPADFPVFKTVPGLFEFLGVCVFSMEGVGVALAIENHMKEPKKFPYVLVGGMSAVISLVTLVGFFGYWGFGDTARSPVTLNFPMSSVVPYILKVFMALMIYVTFALNFWIPFDLVWYYLKKRHPPEKYWMWERIYRAGHIIIITMIAVIFPNVSSFIGLIGSFCLSNMGFIYPAIIEATIDYSEPGWGFMKWRLLKAIFIIIFGIILMIVGTYTNAKQLFSKTWGSQSEA